MKYLYFTQKLFQNRWFNYNFLKTKRQFLPVASVHQLAGPYGDNNLASFIQKGPVASAQVKSSPACGYVDAYRKYGHLKADVNPIFPNQSIVQELEPSHYGVESDAEISSEELRYNGIVAASAEQLTKSLEELYCGHVGIEFMHLPTAAEREWFAEEIEGGTLVQPFSEEEKIHLLKLLLDSQSLDLFLSTKFPTVKRYSGEGAESLMCCYFHTFKTLANHGVPHVVVGMAHRGRLNFLTGLLELPLPRLLSKMMGRAEFSDQFSFTGDTLMHITSSANLEFSDGSRTRVEMLSNPSHLEAVNPVAMGYTRALHRRLGLGQYTSPPRCTSTFCDAEHGFAPAPVTVVVHGDAAMRGQGILQETLALTCVPHFCVGGTLHIVVNNQVGFTTEASGRASDIALAGRVPVLRVNGERPEAVSRTADLAARYQQKFKRDVFVDVLCWRRHGHNELDNPRLTNPRMYSVIDAKTSVPDQYASTLVEAGVVTEAQVAEIQKSATDRLAKAYDEAQSFSPDPSFVLSQWNGLCQCPPSTVEVWDTGVATETLKFVAAKSVEVPEEFNLHRHLLKTHVKARLARVGRVPCTVDWATAEAMAFGSLLLQGVGVRLCGQDVGRGTFAQRHLQLVDQVSEARHLPLNHLSDQQTAFMEVANSILSEEAVLGFEYGMSVNCKDVLHIWEAQFGDFFNGAQTIIDTFVSSGETKWLYQSGLVLLLPHGYDGAGPEHSSCRMERFLTDCHSSDHIADSSSTNWAIAAPTTPAQYFHLLRQQIIRPYRKPLVVVAPKTMLRLPAAVSDVTSMAPGTHFLPVIDDANVEDPRSVERVVLVSGKHYYLLKEALQQRGVSNTALVRVECLCPFPAHQLNLVLKKYSRASKVVWAQEEPRNMGAWPFVFPRLLNICGTKVTYAGREALGTPAVGVTDLHRHEAAAVVDSVFV